MVRFGVGEHYWKVNDVEGQSEGVSGVEDPSEGTPGVEDKSEDVAGVEDKSEGVGGMEDQSEGVAGLMREVGVLVPHLVWFHRAEQLTSTVCVVCDGEYVNRSQIKISHSRQC